MLEVNGITSQLNSVEPLYELFNGPVGQFWQSSAKTVLIITNIASVIPIFHDVQKIKDAPARTAGPICVIHLLWLRGIFAESTSAIKVDGRFGFGPATEFLWKVSNRVADERYKCASVHASIP
jgi:hypothetical protein